MRLTQIEQNALEKILDGAEVRGPDIESSANPWRIKAEVIRKLLLGLPINKTVNVLPRCGLRLHNVIIEGRLNLNEMDGVNHDKLSSLTFKRCHFNGGFSANNACIQSVRLHYSSFSVSSPELPAICLDNATINGTCNLSNVKPLIEGESCRISARDCTIMGSLLITGSRLICPYRETLQPAETPRYALNLLNAKIEGDFESKLGLWASGGVSLKNAKIKGDIWLIGSRIDAGEFHALNLQGMQCEGNLVLRPVHDKENDRIVYNYIHGSVHGFALRLSGGMYFEGVQIGINPYPAKRETNNGYINLGKAYIGESVHIAHYSEKDCVPIRTSLAHYLVLDDSTIIGNVNLIGVSIGAGFWAQRAKIAGELKFSCIEGQTLFRVHTKGSINLHSLELGGALTLLGTKVDGSFEAQESKIVGNLMLAGVQSLSHETPFIATQIKGCLNFRRANIDGAVNLVGLSVQEFVSFFYAHIKGNIELSRESYRDKDKNIHYSTCKIAGNLVLDNSFVGGSHIFNSIDIGGSLTANYSDIQENVAYRAYNSQKEDWNKIGGCVRYSGSKIKGFVSLYFLIVDADKRPQTRGILFDTCTIDGLFELQWGILKTALDLTNSSVGSHVTINLLDQKDRFTAPQFPRITCDFVNVGGNFNLNVSAEFIKLQGSKVAGSLSLAGEIKTQIIGSGTIVGGDLEFKQLSFKTAETESEFKSGLSVLDWSNAEINGTLRVTSKVRGDQNNEFAIKSWFYKLSCYPDYYYVETLFNRPDGTWIAAFLVSKQDWENPTKQGVILCDSHAALFHSLNRNKKLDISSETNAREYMKLFCACVWGDEGAFSVIESAHLIPQNYVKKTYKTGFELEHIGPMKSLPLDTILPGEGKKRIVGINDQYLFKAFIWYSNGVFEAFLLLKKDGSVAMLMDSPVLSLDATYMPKLLPPLYEYHADFAKKSNFVSNHNDEMTRMDSEQTVKFHPVATDVLTQGLQESGLGQTTVNLSNTKTNSLDDNAGQAWGEDVELKLRHFTYHSFIIRNSSSSRSIAYRLKELSRWKIASYRAKLVRFTGKMLAKSTHPKISDNGNRILQNKWSVAPVKPRFTSQQIKTRIRHRLQWLSTQFPLVEKSAPSLWVIRRLNKLPFVNIAEKHRPITEGHFSIQPYMQAASVFRREGAQELARVIDVKARYHAGYFTAMGSGAMATIRYPLHFLYGISSKFGLSPAFVFVWLVVMISIGGIMTEVANQQGVLVVRSSPLSGEIEHEKEKMTVVLSNNSKVTSSPTACGQRIQPILYAADIFIPLIDLGQYQHCVISPTSLATKTQVDKHSKLALWAQELKRWVPKKLSFWRWGQAIYSILGWVMLSLFIFTLTYRLSSYRSENSD